MWIPLVFAVAMLLLLAGSAAEGVSKIGEKFEIIFVYFVIIVTFALTVISIYMSFVVSTSPVLSRTEESYEIVSIRNSEGPSGTFFLGIGSIENELYYVVMAKDDKGYYQKIIKGYEVYIVESNEETPRVEFIDYYRHSPEYSHLFNFNYAGRSHYVIYVPEGTVIVDFRIH